MPTLTQVGQILSDIKPVSKGWIQINKKCIFYPFLPVWACLADSPRMWTPFKGTAQKKLIFVLTINTKTYKKEIKKESYCSNGKRPKSVESHIHAQEVKDR